MKSLIEIAWDWLLKNYYEIQRSSLQRWNSIDINIYSAKTTMVKNDKEFVRLNIFEFGFQF